jgi:hypothetical protein
MDNYDIISSDEGLIEFVMKRNRNDRPTANTSQGMKARKGKIAGLSSPVRAELNDRLERSEPDPSLLAGLDALPEVQEQVRRVFGGEPISKQNLSR